MRLGGVAAHDHHHVGVFDVIPVVGHRSATKARGQCRYGRAVTQARLVFQRQNTQRAGKFLIEQAGLITGGRRAEHRRGRPAVYRHASRVGGLEMSIAILLHQAGNAVKRLIPADALPFIGTRSAVFRVFQALFAVNKVEHACAFRAERSATDRMVRIAFDMVNRGTGIFCTIAQAVDQHAATD